MNRLVNVFASTILVTYFLTACGSGSSSSPDGGGGSTPQTFNIGGTAIKGIIKNGIVKIYGVTNGVTDTTALVEGTTDSKGSYSLTVEDYTGPIVIEITAGTDSVMVCDVFAGCNGVAFGQDFALTSDFSLKAVVSDVQEGEDVTTNITAMTTLAAVLAENATIFDATTVAEANAHVAALFNITGKLTELEVVNLTNPDDVNAASGEAPEAAILNAALLAAALVDAAVGTSPDNALAAMIADFAANNGQMMNNESTDGATVSLAEIFAEALAIIKNPSFAGVDLGTLESTTELLLMQAQAAEPDSTKVVVPANPAVQNRVQAAKNMVERVRAFGLTATYEGSDEATFIASFELATELVSEVDLDTIFDSLDPISTALVIAYEANMAAIDAGLAALTAYTVTNGSELDITVTITSASTGDTYSIDMVVPDTVTGSVALDVDVEATIALEIVEDLTMTDEEFSGVGSLAISGTISSVNVAMTINSGDISIDLDDVFNSSESQNGFEYTETTHVTLASADLNITLAQLTGEAPISFTGQLGLTIDDATESLAASVEDGPILDCDASGSPDGTTDCIGYTETQESSFTLDEFDLTLSGTFSQGSESVTASITINIDPDTSVHIQTDNLISSWTDFYQAGQFIDSVTSFESQSDILGETEDNFIGVDFGIALEFDLAGSSAITGIMLTATRTGLESALLSLDIAVGSDRLEIDVAVAGDDVEMTVTDQNGNTLMLAEACNVETDLCTVTGHIMIDGEQAAIIEEDTDSDIFIITYQDGSFEVL
ncbi:hypothetical protein [Paraglaciecola sp. MB-3u-78]|jgi:hypothetical protein|uniref:hypothetical protein n=1 Tax=Paraglaciecola sp. MB-3u-78 TaxID=2058332 RepID=UPI000C3494A7|nr:hypothetical protein [Paraglaciecola sp. MB-3u-78]PKG97396.1 hypothetical protein CXF95_18715 [Paraglaciecola sp. MB-3u-78]